MPSERGVIEEREGDALHKKWCGIPNIKNERKRSLR
jgi:hypothetical protein